MIDEPFSDAVQMKTTETLETAHLLTNLEFFQADSALGIVYAIFFSGFVREHAGSTECGSR